MPVELLTYKRKEVPLSCFEEYAKLVWTTIQANKGAQGWCLDLPTQVELLLRRQCDLAKQVAIAKAEKELNDLYRRVSCSVFPK